MCGLYFQQQGPQRVAKQALKQMTHRGPDYQALYSQGDATLGHARLSIIDLDERSNQPFHSSEGRYSLLFNGEIYNYMELRAELKQRDQKFFTASDTEVVLHMYSLDGVSSFARLDGMFAILIVDWFERKVVFTRDRFGEKPLFYSIDPTFGLRVSSYYFSLQPIFDPESSAANGSLDFLLYRGFLPRESTLDPAIKKVPPGQVVEFQLDFKKFEMISYVDAPEHKLQAVSTSTLMDTACTEAWRLIVDSVSKRMRSDVEYGFFLSGGVDSSLLVAAASECSSSLKTFTFKQRNSALDESTRASEVARYFGTQHTEVELNQQFDLIDLMAGLDEPIGDSSYVPTAILCEAAAQNVTVMLGGDGGDELFLGYPRYGQVGDDVRNERDIWRLIAEIGKQLPIGVKGREWLIAGATSHGAVLRYTPYFNEFDRPKLLPFPLSKDYDYIPPVNSAKQYANYEIKNLFKNDYLVKVDRGAMRSSLEVRLPYLSVELFDYISSLPEKLLSHKSLGQRILQRFLYQQKMPSHLRVSSKKGFSFNYLEYFGSDCEDLILDNLLKYKFDEGLLRGLLKRKNTNSAKIFLLFSLAFHIQSCRRPC